MKDTVCDKMTFRAGGSAGKYLDYSFERNNEMAKCERCGKTTTFGHNRSFSLRATNRVFRPNLQRVTVIENGRRVKKLLCAKCIRTSVKSA